jgi:hypothetical protein
MNSLPAITRILELEQVGLVLLKPPIEIQRIRSRGLFRAVRPPTKRGGNLCEGRLFVHAHIDSTNGTAVANQQQGILGLPEEPDTPENGASFPAHPGSTRKKPRTPKKRG